MPEQTARLHMMKLAPGVQDLAMMQAWVDREVAFTQSQGNGDTVYLGTRNIPKRREEILEGGSLFWVWKSQIQARQVIREILTEFDNNEKKYCLIGLEPKLIEVAPSPRRAFQGWRYAEVDTVPPDLGGKKDEIEGMSEEMKADLARIGVL